MNLPNKLTVLRMCLVPVIIVVLLLPVNMATNILGAFIFLATALTDLFDGKIASALRNFYTFIFQIFLFFLIFRLKYAIMFTTKTKEAKNERDFFSRGGAGTAFVVSTK